MGKEFARSRGVDRLGVGVEKGGTYLRHEFTPIEKGRMSAPFSFFGSLTPALFGFDARKEGGRFFDFRSGRKTAPSVVPFEGDVACIAAEGREDAPCRLGHEGGDKEGDKANTLKEIVHDRTETVAFGGVFGQSPGGCFVDVRNNFV